MTRITLSLVAHTNVGKTTLARTLLGREVGEVRDAPHVTEAAEGHVLVATGTGNERGDELALWDTPGFGDSARLARRMAKVGTPIGWLLSEVWDRLRDRPFWATQQALRHVQTETDVVLYLVNAAERPEGSAYVAPEMEILAWVGKPVVVLLNQLGVPRPADDEAGDVRRWREHLAPWPRVRAVLPMDAFARCWVQEVALLDAVAGVLEGDEQRPAMQRLAAEWLARRRTLFDASIAELAASLARIAAARVPIDDDGGRLAEWFVPVARRLGLARGTPDPAETARQALAAALDTEVRESTARLIALHGLPGTAQGEILGRVAERVQAIRPLSEGRAAVLGGAVAGALAGLKADIASGGLTLGGGLLAGGILGALGAAGLARGVNLVRGTGRAFVAWNADAMRPATEAALLRYLAVAHFGRGRGEWSQGESPAHWVDAVAATVDERSDALAAIWSRRSDRYENPGEVEALAAALQPQIDAAARTLLRRLYPDAGRVLAG